MKNKYYWLLNTVYLIGQWIFSQYILKNFGSLMNLFLKRLVTCVNEAFHQSSELSGPMKMNKVEINNRTSLCILKILMEGISFV